MSAREDKKALGPRGARSGQALIPKVQNGVVVKVPQAPRRAKASAAAGEGSGLIGQVVGSQIGIGDEGWQKASPQRMRSGGGKPGHGWADQARSLRRAKSRAAAQLRDVAWVPGLQRGCGGGRPAGRRLGMRFGAAARVVGKAGRRARRRVSVAYSPALALVSAKRRAEGKGARGGAGGGAAVCVSAVVLHGSTPCDPCGSTRPPGQPKFAVFW
mmetsp:Transcript_3133/g.9156  ORF Transcript_3133/g.9156 Transcript_3133/m.9156 type:complete len:214 (-) Transcript_3133:29-670(-)